MREKPLKLLNLISNADRLDRACVLLEIRLNRLFFTHKLAKHGTLAFEEFLTQLSHKDSTLFDLLKSGGEAEEAVQWISSRFQELAREGRSLPFPTFYNADKSLALLSYGLARHLRPRFVLETGVGYGITSALILLALERNNAGELVSIDLPSLSDPPGLYTGLAVPEQSKGRWHLHLGSSRRYLPKLLSDMSNIGLFISDSANVYTLQRYEYEAVSEKLRTAGGAAIFNNIGSKFQTFLCSVKNKRFYGIWQVEKPSCVTGLIMGR